MTISPYPGLRPFTEDEEDIFFGREEQIEGLLEKLGEHRFLAVVGPSGCGKSSLVKAGMLPALKNGFLIPAGENWRIASLRPGASPVLHLAGALHRALDENAAKALEPADSLAISFVAASLRRGPLGIAEVFREARLPGKTNLLVLVDQFEEIFRYRNETGTDEAEAFVNLLLAAAQAEGLRIYVTLTMRSDFLGDCALFMGLPEAMNDSQFLTPRLTREQRRAAITGPAGILGGSVEPVLVNRLLNDMGADPDQLPLLQHCLMRMWTNAAEAGKPVRLTLEGYAAVGGVENALSGHADKAFEELSDERKRIAEVLFKCLTERGEGERDTRRPVRLAEVATVAQVDVEAVAAVADVFRRGNRSFLTLSGDGHSGETVADISHESLIRQWGKLQEWVEDEAESAETYRRLESSAQLWQVDKEALLIPPGLDVALEWKKKKAPRKEWAERYGGDFDLAVNYLAESEKERQEKIIREEAERIAEQERKDALQREKLRRTRQLLSLTMIALVIAAVLSIWGFWERSRADAARDQAVQTERKRTKDLFEAHLTHASLQAKNEDYDQAREILKKTRELDKDIPPERQHARNLMAWYTDLMGGQADKVYKGAGAPLLDVAVSPDGKTLAAVGERGTVVLFDEASGEVVQRLVGHNPDAGKYGAVLAAVFHPKDYWLATAGDDQQIILWALPQGEKLRKWEAPAQVLALALSPDGKTLASDGTDNAITLWNPETGEKLKTLEGHENIVSGLAFSPDGTLLASASYDRTAQVWEVESGEIRQVLAGHTAQVASIQFHPDGKVLASSGADKYIVLWNVRTGRRINVLRGHENYVVGLQFIAGGSRLVSAGMDRTLRIWDTDTGVTLRVLQGHTAGVIGLALHGSTLYSAANDRTVRRWQAGIDGAFGGMKVADIGGELISSAISPDGTKAVVGLANGDLILYAFPSLELLWKNEDANNSRIMRLAFNKSGSRIATAHYDDNTVKLWQSSDGSHLKTFTGHTDAVHAIAFSPDGATIASASYDGRIGLFNSNAAEGRFFEAHEGEEVNSVAFDAKGQQFMSCSDHGIRLWNIRSQPPESVMEYPKSNETIMWAALSPDGTRIAAVGRGNKKVRIFNARTGKEENTFVGHESAVYRAEFSPDGGQVATVSMDATIRFWDLKTDSELFTINLPTNKYPPEPLWDFSFRCTQNGNCLIAVPLTRGKLVVYEMRGVY